MFYANHAIYCSLYGFSLSPRANCLPGAGITSLQGIGGAGGVFQETLYEQRFWRETAGKRQRQPCLEQTFWELKWATNMINPEVHTRSLGNKCTTWLGREYIKVSTVLSLGFTALICADGIEVEDTEHWKCCKNRGLIEITHLSHLENAPGRYSPASVPIRSQSSIGTITSLGRCSYYLIPSAPIELEHVC